MIRLTPQRRFHVSNRAAIFAALVLFLTFFTSIKGEQDNGQQFVESTPLQVTQQADNTASNTTSKHKLNFGLLLFGRG